MSEIAVDSVTRERIRQGLLRAALRRRGWPTPGHSAIDDHWRVALGPRKPSDTSPLERSGAEITKRGIPPLSIVEELEVLEELAARRGRRVGHAARGQRHSSAEHQR
jgi:hypothetical protein